MIICFLFSIRKQYILYMTNKQYFIYDNKEEELYTYELYFKLITFDIWLIIDGFVKLPRVI